MISSDQFEAMARRLERVERTNRRMKIAGLLGVLLVVVVVTTGAMLAPGEVVEASKIHIVDNQGNVRMVLGYNPEDGNSYINFWDGNRKLRVNLWAGGTEGFMHADAAGNAVRVW
jgi:hypothetical protein